MENQNNTSPVDNNPPQGGGTSVPAADNNVLFGVLSYLGPLIIVSYLMAKDKPTVKFHIKQGLVLVIIELIVWILGMMSYQFWMIANIINLATLVLSIIGIVNVVQHHEKELPVVGQFSRYFKF